MNSWKTQAKTLPHLTMRSEILSIDLISLNRHLNPAALNLTCDKTFWWRKWHSLDSTKALWFLSGISFLVISFSKLLLLLPRFKQCINLFCLETLYLYQCSQWTLIEYQVLYSQVTWFLLIVKVHHRLHLDLACRICGKDNLNACLNFLYYRRIPAF